MNRFKFEAMVTEFPIIKEFDVDQNDEIKVKRWDTKVLESVPDEYEITGSLVNCYATDAWYAVLEDGTLTGNIATPRYGFQSHYAHSQDRFRRGRSLLESLDELSKTPIMLINRWIRHDDTRGRELTHSSGLTIYKPGRDCSIETLIDQARVKAAAEVAAEVTF